MYDPLLLQTRPTLGKGSHLVSSIEREIHGTPWSTQSAPQGNPSAEALYLSIIIYNLLFTWLRQMQEKSYFHVRVHSY